MKKAGLVMIAMLTLTTAWAQTILTENFETGNTGDHPTPITVGEGWTVVNGYTGTKTAYNWHNEYNDPTVPNGGAIEGSCCAAVSAPRFNGDSTDGYGPREEILLSPELNLDDTYQLQFSWSVSPMNCQDASRYDLQVRVVTDNNLVGAETVFSIQSEKMLRESGVPVFPIQGWEPYTSRIDLSDFKGEKVKLAFVYKMDKDIANQACVDAVSVTKFTPATTPVASITLDRLNFSNVMIGEKRYSDILSLVNTGTDGLVINSVELPEGVSLTFNPTDVNLDTYRSVNFRVGYTASLASATSGNIILHTNGGDVTIAMSANKTFVTDGCMLETFEEYFPPAGWTSSGWGRSQDAIEGDWSAFSDGGYTRSVLTSPRLDLSADASLKFRYIARFFSDDPEAAPEYDVSLEVSHDGGETWTNAWTADYTRVNELIEIDLPLSGGSGNDLVRWIYPAVEVDDDGAAPHYSFIMDMVQLPNVVGADAQPKAASNPSPETGTEKIFPTDVKLSWAPAQFAEGYKLYVGSNDAANNLVNGEDLGNVRSYTIAQCDYSTTYRWKVVPYNSKGDCRNVPVWTFTTQADAAVSVYPYEENFTDGFPEGWTNVPSDDIYKRKWEINSIYPYVFDNKRYSVLYDGWLDPGKEATVITPEFKLPAGNASTISFLWGDAHPSDMKIDPTGLAAKNNAEPDNGIGITYFEILVDGNWEQLSYLSEKPADNRYWVGETIDLTPYQGKTVKFRWRNKSLSTKHNGASLTHIVVDAKSDNKAEFNLSNWDAGKVNHNKSLSSGEIFTLLNTGEAKQTIAKVESGKPNFESTLKSGDVIEPKSGLTFAITYNALTTASEIATRVDDMLTVTFESGLIVKLPVSGTSLPVTTRYYSFEPNDNELQWEDHFTMIDRDNGYSYQFSSASMYYPLNGRKGAFCVASDAQENGLWGIMKPVSGMHALVAPCPEGAKADNWLISEKLHATDNARIDFYARNWDCLGTVEPDPLHKLSLLVSTNSNNDIDDFAEELPAEEIPLLDNDNWKAYSIDLSKYADKDIYVALRHTTDEPTNVAFIDDIELSGFTTATGIECVETMIDSNSTVEVFNISGVKVAEGLASEAFASLHKGVYVVCTTHEGVKRTFKIVK